MTAVGSWYFGYISWVSGVQSLCWLISWTPGTKLTVSSSLLLCNLSPILTDICVFLCLGPGRMVACKRTHRDAAYVRQLPACVSVELCLGVMWECVNVCESLQLLRGGFLCCETETLQAAGGHRGKVVTSEHGTDSQLWLGHIQRHIDENKRLCKKESWYIVLKLTNLVMVLSHYHYTGSVEYSCYQLFETDSVECQIFCTALELLVFIWVFVLSIFYTSLHCTK